MTTATCRCGHGLDRHRGLHGRCMTFIDGLDDAFDPWKSCDCAAFDDSVLPAPGERLTFGVHRQPTVHAETAEAWPPMATWSSRIKAKTTRALRSLR